MKKIYKYLLITVLMIFGINIKVNAADFNYCKALKHECTPVCYYQATIKGEAKEVAIFYNSSTKSFYFGYDGDESRGEIVTGSFPASNNGYISQDALSKLIKENMCPQNIYFNDGILFDKYCFDNADKNNLSNSYCVSKDGTRDLFEEDEIVNSTLKQTIKLSDELLEEITKEYKNEINEDSKQTEQMCTFYKNKTDCEANSYKGFKCSWKEQSNGRKTCVQSNEQVSASNNNGLSNVTDANDCVSKKTCAVICKYTAENKIVNIYIDSGNHIFSSISTKNHKLRKPSNFTYAENNKPTLSYEEKDDYLPITEITNKKVCPESVYYDSTKDSLCFETATDKSCASGGYTEQQKLNASINNNWSKVNVDNILSGNSNSNITSCSQIKNSDTCKNSKVNGHSCVWRQNACYDNTMTDDGSNETTIQDNNQSTNSSNNNNNNNSSLTCKTLHEKIKTKYDISKAYEFACYKTGDNYFAIANEGNMYRFFTYKLISGTDEEITEYGYDSIAGFGYKSSLTEYDDVYYIEEKADGKMTYFYSNDYSLFKSAVDSETVKGLSWGLMGSAFIALFTGNLPVAVGLFIPGMIGGVINESIEYNLLLNYKRYDILILVGLEVDNTIVDINDCASLLGADLVNEINSYFIYLKVAVPIIIIVMGSIDFGKAFIASDEEAMKKAQKHFIQRLIIGIIIFFIPTILNILLNIANSVWADVAKDTCGMKF